ncbi:MAG: hypothetical protein ACKVZ0_16110 [Gemmatimonadales bacterium]
MFARHGSSTLAAIIALAGFSAPAALLILGTSTTTTGVAGGNGTDVVTLGPTGPYQGLTKVTWAEDSDIPCWFEVKSRHINLNSVQSYQVDLGGSSCNQTSQSQREAGEAPSEHFINGISVCRNNQRIKGVKVFYARVHQPNGTLTSMTEYDWDFSAACDQYGDGWSTERYCPTGRVATQLKIYHKSDTPAFSNNIKEAATGIALVCRAVEVKP